MCMKPESAIPASKGDEQDYYSVDASSLDSTDDDSSTTTSEDNNSVVNLNNNNNNNNHNQGVSSVQPTHSAWKRPSNYDTFLYLLPLLASPWTPVGPMYLVAGVRWLVTHVILSLHYRYVDKDNYHHKLSQAQITREKEDYSTAILLHLLIQVVLQLVFPTMFFGTETTTSQITACAKEALLCHVFVVEPLYYFVHRWLHVPKQMKAMHGFHHLSINTYPATGGVQNFQEHLVYVAVFGPAFFLPFLLQGRQHWMVIGIYLILFDIVNAWGHCNVVIRNKFWTSKYSPLHYLLYTPEYHLGHHNYFTANYILFMPVWDYLFGTARDYQKKPSRPMLPANQQDFVFIGHNGGLGHTFTIPELCVYNVYDQYKQTWLPIQLEFYLMHLICQVTRAAAKLRLIGRYYYCSRFCIANEYIGRIVVLLRTPWDYMGSSNKASSSTYDDINREIIDLIRHEHQTKGTRYFGLGNLNKMKQLNDGGVVVANMVRQDPYLCDKRIRVWTGDTMTVASVYHQIADIPNLKEFYYIGAGGKVGTAVCELLVRNKPHVKIRIFSRNQVLDHPNISYSTDLSEIVKYKVVLVGKILSGEMYRKAFSGAAAAKSVQTRFILDYTVPALPIAVLKQRPENIQHVRIGLLKTFPNNPFLKGHYDVCMSHDENHIVPCHWGCIYNCVEGRETDEIGDIDQSQVERLWKAATARGFQNIEIDYDCD